MQVVHNLKDIPKKLLFMYKLNKPMKDLTDEENEAFNWAKSCHICGNEFDSKSIKVKDSDHLI